MFCSQWYSFPIDNDSADGYNEKESWSQKERFAMEFNEKIHVGATHEVHGAVTEENTAATVGSGSLAVYATPAMAALMERAAAELCALRSVHRTQ